MDRSQSEERSKMLARLSTMDVDDKLAAGLIEEYIDTYVHDYSIDDEFATVVQRFIGSVLSDNRYEALHALVVIGKRVTHLTDVLTVLSLGLAQETNEVFLAMSCLGVMATAGEEEATLALNRFKSLAQRSDELQTTFGYI